MGGKSYDRDVYSSSSSSAWSSGYSSYSNSSYSSDVANRKLSSSSLSSDMLPNHKNLVSKSKNPIIVVLDVTGSNIEFAKILYDKLPMLYGQIEQQGYLPDFDISICAVGDAYTDDYPMQIGDFAKGIELDAQIEKIVLESGGGGQRMESYELMAYYLLQKATFEKGSEPIIFFIGDEAPYPKVNKKQAEKFGIPCEKELDPFAALREKMKDNVYMLLNPYCRRSFYELITSEWEKRLAPEHVIKMLEEKSVVDLMLGIIAMTANTRSLENYTVDMLNRGQTQARIANVTQSLKKLSTTMEMVKVEGDMTTVTPTRKTMQKGKRL